MEITNRRKVDVFCFLHGLHHNVFLRKQILTKLAQIDEADPENELTHQVRRVLRRKLSIAEYRTLLGELEAQCKQMSTAVDAPETMKLPANDGQTVRHHSKSKKEQKDLSVFILA